jgi:hypothetical protein
MLQISVLALTALLLQGPSLDSTSPKERQAAIELMAKPGNIEAIPAFESALKKEPKSEVRAELLSGLVRIGGSAVPPVIARSLATDLDKDVRLQAVDSLQRLYIPATDTGTLKTLFNTAKNVVTGPQRPRYLPESSSIKYPRTHWLRRWRRTASKKFELPPHGRWDL